MNGGHGQIGAQIVLAHVLAETENLVVGLQRVLECLHLTTSIAYHNRARKNCSERVVCIALDAFRFCHHRR